MKEYTSPAKKAEKVIDFTLDGEEYNFTVQKKAGLFATGNMTRDFLNWLSDGLPEEQSDRIAAKLADKDDTFDLDQVAEIATDLMSELSGRPTKKR